MSTAPMDPPLRALFTPTDAAEVARALAEQKRRWGAFLGARDAVLVACRAAGTRLLGIAEQLRLGGVVALTRRGLNWLLRGRTRRVLSVTGLRPAVLWALTTESGQRLVGAAARPVGQLLANVARSSYRTTVAGLRRLGHVGGTLADRLEGAARRARHGATRLRPALDTAAFLLSPSGILAHTVNGWARSRAITSLLLRRLPRPGRLLGWAVVLLTAVPAAVRGQAYRFAADLVSGRGDDDPTPPAAAMRLVPPADPADPEPEVERRVVNEPLEKSLQRHPASKRKPNAKKRR